MIKNSVFVFGGSSPIAIAISKHLQTSSKVVHFSRDVKQECFRDLIEAGVHLEKLDFLELKLDLFTKEKLTPLFEKHLPNHIIFSQRSKEGTLEKSLHTDVIAVDLIIKQFISLRQPLAKSAVLLTSPASTFIQASQEVGYHVAKAAQLQLARFYAANCKKYGLRVNCISPGAFVEKERSREFYAERENLVRSINDRIPLGRFAKVHDIALLVEFLISERSDYINGQEIFLDGGLSILDQSMFIGNS